MLKWHEHEKWARRRKQRKTPSVRQLSPCKSCFPLTVYKLGDFFSQEVLLEEPSDEERVRKGEHGAEKHQNSNSIRAKERTVREIFS